TRLHQLDHGQRQGIRRRRTVGGDRESAHPIITRRGVRDGRRDCASARPYECAAACRARCRRLAAAAARGAAPRQSAAAQHELLVPGVRRMNVPGRIVQKGGAIWLLNSVENELRILPLDGRKRDENDYQFSSFNGMGLAHWDGDTLVIESVGFNDISWLGWEGYFHSDKMEVTERFLRQGDILYYNFTVNDPEVLLEPWTSYTYVRRVNNNPNRQDEATECDERDLKLLADPFLRG